MFVFLLVILFIYFPSAEEMRIIFRTKPLEETSLVLSYGIKHMSTIQIVRKLPGGIWCGPDAGGKTPTDPKHAAVTPIMIINNQIIHI